MGLTSDPTDPRIARGPPDTEPRPQEEMYLVLSEEERAKGFVRPLRDVYRHKICGTTTTMALPMAETYAREPHFYGATYCVRCQMHRAVSEFAWLDGSAVGS